MNQGWTTEQEGFCSQAKEVDRWLRRGLEYGIAAEHAYSRCISIADCNRFEKQDRMGGILSLIMRSFSRVWSVGKRLRRSIMWGVAVLSGRGMAIEGLVWRMRGWIEREPTLIEVGGGMGFEI